MDMEYYVPEDFVSDESFVNYCFQTDPQDVSFWEQWLADHPARKEIAEKAREWVFYTSIKSSPEEKQQQWEKLEVLLKGTPLATGDPHRWELHTISRTGVWAATLLVMVAGVMVFYWTLGKRVSKGIASSSDFTQYITSAGQRHTIVLSDGTQVWLNADSRLACSDSFQTGKEREVTLSGEAYFKVAPNPTSPFVIHTQKLDVRVLGTELNIEAYPGENKEVAALIKGSIQVSLRADPDRRIILKPREKAVVVNNLLLIPSDIVHDKKEKRLETPNNLIIAPLTTDSLLDSGTVETAWMEGKLVFRNESFSQLARQMERWYDVDIHFSNSSMEKYRFTGIFSTETIDQALQALQLTSPSDPFNYKINGKDVLIDQNKNEKAKG